LLVASGQSAFSADQTGKPVVVAAVAVQRAEGKIVRAPARPLNTREASIQEGSLEKFGSVGLPQ
jgi:hypothetical protein